MWFYERFNRVLKAYIAFLVIVCMPISAMEKTYTTDGANKRGVYSSDKAQNLMPINSPDIKHANDLVDDKGSDNHFKKYQQKRAPQKSVLAQQSVINLPKGPIVETLSKVEDLIQQVLLDKRVKPLTINL